MNYRQIILFIVLAFTINTVTAQADTTIYKQSLNLSQYLQIVSENNLEYVAEKYNVQISEAAIEMAKVFPDPSISFDWLENRENSNKTGYGYASELGTTIELGGKRKARIEFAEGEKSLTQALLNDYFRNLRADATLVFLEAEKQNQLYKVIQSSYNTMKKLSDADSIRLIMGSIMQNDAVQSKLESGMLFNELLKADASRSIALRQLNLMAGVSTIDTLLVPKIKMEGVLRSFNRSELIETAVQNRTDIVSAQLNVDLSVKNSTLVKKERRADLDVKIGFEDGYSVPDIGYGAQIFSAGVAIPLKFSNFNKGELVAARLYEQQSQKQYDFVKQKIITEIIQAHREFTATEKQIINFKSNLLQQSESVLKGKIYIYERGETSLLEVLNAQRTFNEIQSSYIEALVDNYIALVELERAAGIWDINF